MFFKKGISVDNIFENNLVALARVNTKLAEELVVSPINTKYEVCVGNDKANINIVDIKNNFKPLYLTNSILENTELLKNLEEKSNYKFLYFYGVGNGVFYKMLLKAFGSLEQVFIFEPELELLKIVFSLIDFSKEIESEKLFFMNSKTFTFDNSIRIHSKRDDIAVYAKLYELIPLLSYYEEEHKNNLLDVNNINIRALEHIFFTMGNSPEDSLIGLEHHIANLPYMVTTPTLDELVKKVTNTSTVIIVSTGPSLSKQLSRLKKIQDNVTIFCADASFSILSDYGIIPDVVFSLERIALTAEFYKNTPAEFHKKPLFCITSIAHRELLDSIKSSNIQLSMRAFHYLHYFDTPNWGPLGFGMSVANMAFELVQLSNFQNCVFIGQDLSYGKDGNTHAKGTVVGTSDLEQDDKDTIEEVEAYGGKGFVKTKPIWKAFKTYLEQDMPHVSKKMDVYNCTEGGARIKGTKEISFDEFIEKNVSDNKKKKIVLKKPSKKFIEKNRENYLKKLTRMKEYILKVKKETESVFLNLMECLESIEDHNKKGKLDDIDFKIIERIIEDIDRVKIYFKDKEFYSIVYDFLKSEIMSQELNIAKIQIKKTTSKEDEKAKAVEWLYVHKFWLFSLAGGMEAILTSINRGMNEWQ